MCFNTLCLIGAVTPSCQTGGCQAGWKPCKNHPTQRKKLERVPLLPSFATLKEWESWMVKVVIKVWKEERVRTEARSAGEGSLEWFFFWLYFLWSTRNSVELTCQLIVGCPVVPIRVSCLCACILCSPLYSYCLHFLNFSVPLSSFFSSGTVTQWSFPPPPCCEFALTLPSTLSAMGLHLLLQQ